MRIKSTYLFAFAVFCSYFGGHATAFASGFRCFPRLASYDLDRDGYLSTDELDRLPLGDLRIVFFAHEESVSAEEFDRVFESLPINKQASVLTRWPQAQPQMLLRLAKRNPDQAVELLLRTKEPMHARDYRGSLEGERATLFLRNLPVELKNDLLARLERREPKYTQNIRHRLQDRVDLVASSSSSSLNPSGKNEPLGIRPNHNMPVVFQKEYIFTDAGQHPEVQTHSMNTCVAFSLYDPQTKLGMLAHVDHGPDGPEFDRILQRFIARGVPARRLVAGLYGTDRSWAATQQGPEVISSLKHWLSEWDIPLKYDKTFVRNPHEQNVIFDLRDGTAHHFQTVVDFDPESSRRKHNNLEQNISGKQFAIHESSLPTLACETATASLAKGDSFAEFRGRK